MDKDSYLSTVGYAAREAPELAYELHQAEWATAISKLAKEALPS